MEDACLTAAAVITLRGKLAELVAVLALSECFHKGTGALEAIVILAALTVLAVATIAAVTAAMGGNM